MTPKDKEQLREELEELLFTMQFSKIKDVASEIMDLYTTHLQSIREAVEAKVIGMDEDIPPERHIAGWPEVYRNKLRAEQRRKLAALVKGMRGDNG